jgi:4-hydroxybenzoate polyprenyltransferase
VKRLRGSHGAVLVGTVWMASALATSLVPHFRSWLPLSIGIGFIGLGCWFAYRQRDPDRQRLSPEVFAVVLIGGILGVLWLLFSVGQAIYWSQ